MLHGLVKLRLFAAKVPGAPLMGILFGTAICWIEGFCRGPEHSVFGYPFGTDGDRWDMGLRWVEVVSARISCPTEGIPTYTEMISTRVGNGSFRPLKAPTLQPLKLECFGATLLKR